MNYLGGIIVTLCLALGAVPTAVGANGEGYDLPPVSVREAFLPSDAAEGPSDAACVTARARAWVTALRQAAANLPRRQEFNLRAADTHLGLAAQLYRLDEALCRQEGDAPHALVRLLPRSSLQQELALAIRNPDLLDMRSRLIRETEAILAAPPTSRTRRRPQTSGQPPFTDSTQALKGLWLAQAALALCPDGWLAWASALPDLEKAAQLAQGSPTVHLLLAEARLQHNLPQECLLSCNTALLLAPEWDRALYIRGLAHWRLQHLALAVADLDAALALDSMAAPHGEDLIRRLRARGAVHMLRGEYAEMCDDFTAACGQGDCEALAEARRQGYCRAMREGSRP